MRTFAIVVTILATLLIGFAFVNAQQSEQQAAPPSDQQMQSNQPAWNYCPYCGRAMGPGVGGPKYKTGEEMSGRRMPMKSQETRQRMEGYGYYGPGCPPNVAAPVDEQGARNILQSYIGNNPNLKVGDFQPKDDGFQARIVTKEGSLVDEVFIDKNTGRMRSIY